MRYQTTHDRAFHKSLNDLLRLRAEKRKLEIGFELQERKRREEARKEADQIRKQEMHETRLRSIEAKTSEREIDNDIRHTVEAPLPGHMRIPFEAMKDTFSLVVDEVNRKLKAESGSKAA